MSVMYNNSAWEKYVEREIHNAVEAKGKVTKRKQAFADLLSSTGFDAVIYSAIVANSVCIFLPGDLSDQINTVSHVIMLYTSVLCFIFYSNLLLTA